jgi:hypothetical protein
MCRKLLLEELIVLELVKNSLAQQELRLGYGLDDSRFLYNLIPATELSSPQRPSLRTTQLTPGITRRKNVNIW